MRFFKSFSLVLALAFLSLKAVAQFGSMPPFTLSIEPVIAPPLPAMHSFAFAQSGDKWLIIGGRTNGLHGLNSSGPFPYEYKNDVITVIDTTTWAYYSADLNQLPQVIAGPMRSTNMQYLQDGDYLYMVGGYGYDSLLPKFTTFPTLTAIHVDNMINAVINALPVASTVRQITDTNFVVCGGEMGKIGNDYYLMFGHDFQGNYADNPGPLFTQVYDERIKKFTLSDDGTTLTASGFTYQTDTTYFHRRDLNSGPIIRPDGSMAISAYGGVFRKDSNLPVREPITITSTGTIISPYQQVMNHYTCAMLPIYDSLTQKMYTTFFGGISLYDYNETTGIIKRDSLVPFVNDITTMTVNSAGAIEETILPETMPGLLGSNAKFVPTQHLASYANEVIRLRDLPNTKLLAGYIFGGIRAVQGNFGISTANDSVYRVFITPNNFIMGTNDLNVGIQNIQVFPNPSTESTTLYFRLKSREKVRIDLTAITGKEIFVVAEEQLEKGDQKISLKTADLAAGIYFCRIKSESCERVIKLIVAK